MRFCPKTIITRWPFKWKLMVTVCLGTVLIASNEPVRAAQASPAVPRPSKPRAAADVGTPYAGREDVVDFARRTAAAHDLDPRWVRRQLASAKRLPAVQKLIMPPPVGTAKNWGAYRDRFLTPQRVQAGVDFWQQNERWLQAAQARWGVPPEVIVGIVGVETFYGRIMGTFRVLDALATLSFDFPSGRSDRSECAQVASPTLSMTASTLPGNLAPWANPSAAPSDLA